MKRYRGRHRLTGRQLRLHGWLSRPWYALTEEIEDRLEDRLQVWGDDEPIPFLPTLPTVHSMFPTPFSGGLT